MRWLAHATRVPTMLAIGLLAGAIAGLARGATAPMPSLTLGTLAPVPVVAVMALVPAIGVLWGGSGMRWEAMASSARPIAIVVGPILATCLASFILAAWVLGDLGSLLENTRNAVGLLGLTLLGARFRGERGAVLLPIAFLFAAFLFGRRAGSPEPSWWAWILFDGGSAPAGACACVLALAGALVLPGIPAATLRQGQD